MPTIAQSYDPAFPVDQLVEHPDNPRRGDEGVIEDSIAAHGFYGAVLVQTATKRIIAGNHRTRVARRVGEATVPVLFLDVDDDQARRLLLVDNRANDLALYDNEVLRNLLSDLADSEPELSGTGYTDAELAELLAMLEADTPPEFPKFDEVKPTEHRCPSCGYEWSGKAAE